MARRDKLMDVVFMMDATASMTGAIMAATDKIRDIAFELHTGNRDGDFQFGCVCYRDPVDAPDDRHEVHDLVPYNKAEVLSEWLDTIEADGGGDGPEDYVGALALALNGGISWRPGGKRALIWVADAPAHGQQFCGDRNHQAEEPKLREMVIRIAHEKDYFVGLSIKNGADLTYSEMRGIYQAHGGPSFVVESFVPDMGNEVGRIAETMLNTTKRAAQIALTPRGPPPVCTVAGCPNEGR
jgi:hypothetical protein